MKKNSNFKNISFTNFEFIAVILLLSFCSFISFIPNNLIQSCGSGTIICTIIICIIAFIFFKIIISKIFNNEFDLYEVFKKVYSPTIYKGIGIVLYLFSILLTYILIGNIVFNLRSTSYPLSTNFEVALFFLVGLFLITKKGFNSLFRIAGYVFVVMIIYLLVLFLISLPHIEFQNFFPILGTGLKSITLASFKNLVLFIPFFFMLFFGGNILKEKRSNMKNYHKAFSILAISFLILMIMFIGAMPIKLLNTRYVLIFDISRIITFNTTSLKLSPAMIFTFSIITFISSSFTLLTGAMSLERLKVIKDYSNIIFISIALVVLLFMLPQTLNMFNKIFDIFSYLSILIAFIFPAFTIFIYSIKYNKKNKKYIEVKNNE